MLLRKEIARRDADLRPRRQHSIAGLAQRQILAIRAIDQIVEQRIVEHGPPAGQVVVNPCGLACPKHRSTISRPAHTASYNSAPPCSRCASTHKGLCNSPAHNSNSGAQQSSQLRFRGLAIRAICGAARFAAEMRIDSDEEMIYECVPPTSTASNRYVQHNAHRRHIRQNRYKPPKAVFPRENRPVWPDACSASLHLERATTEWLRIQMAFPVTHCHRFVDVLPRPPTRSPTAAGRIQQHLITAIAAMTE